MEKTKKAEIRKHYFLDQYVIFSPKRNLRPKSLHEEDKQKREALKESCFFCPDQVEEEIIYRLGDEKKWKVLIINNKFPALTLDNPKAFGKQEVLIETPEHNKELSDLPVEHIVDILKIYKQRTEELKKIEGIRHVLVFKNDGGKAGASIPHSHSQIIAMPIIPPKIQAESAAMDKYFLENDSCAYCDIIKQEIDSERVIYLDENIIAICPHASSNAYGAWILPLSHRRTLGDLKHAELESLAKCLKKITGKLDKADISYNYFLDNSLDNESHHFLIKVIPRMNIWAGLELGTGVIINPVFPEEAARFYRNENS